MYLKLHEKCNYVEITDMACISLEKYLFKKKVNETTQVYESANEKRANIPVIVQMMLVQFVPYYSIWVSLYELSANNVLTQERGALVTRGYLLFHRSAADAVVCKGGRFEEVIVSSREIAASSMQLVMASRVKADRDSTALGNVNSAAKTISGITGKEAWLGALYDLDFRLWIL